MQYKNTFYYDYSNPGLRNEKVPGPAGYIKLDSAKARAWEASIRSAMHLLPRNFAPIVQPGSSGKNAFSMLQTCALDLSKFLCNVINSEFNTTSAIEAPAGYSAGEVEAALCRLSEEKNLVHGKYLDGLRSLGRWSRQPEIRRLLDTRLPEECGRFVAAATGIKESSKWGIASGWQLFIEEHCLKGGFRGVKLETLLDSVVQVRNADAHDKGGAQAGERLGGLVSLSSEGSEEWSTVLAHYLAPALRALLVEPTIQAALCRLQVVQLERTNVPTEYRVKAWTTAMTGPAWGAEILHTDVNPGAEALVRFKESGEPLELIAPFVLFPKPRVSLDDQRAQLRRFGLKALIKSSEPPDEDHFDTYRDEEKLSSALDAKPSRDEALASYAQLRRWAASPEPSSELTEQLRQDLAAIQESRTDSELRVHINEHEQRRRDRVITMVGNSMLTVADITLALGDSDLAASALDGLKGDPRIYQPGRRDAESTSPTGIVRIALGDQVQPLLVSIEQVREAIKDKRAAGRHLAVVLQQLRRLLKLVGVEEELKNPPATQGGMSDEGQGRGAQGGSLFDDLEKWINELEEASPVATSPIAEGSLSLPSLDGLVLVIDDRELRTEGLPAMFRAVMRATDDESLRYVCDKLYGLAGEQVRIDYNRYLFNTENRHRNGQPFENAVEVGVGNQRLFFEGGLPRAQGLYHLARALTLCGFSVRAEIDGNEMYSQAEVDRQLKSNKSYAKSVGHRRGEGAPEDDKLKRYVEGELIRAPNARSFMERMVRKVVERVGPDAFAARLPILASSRAEGRYYVLASAPVHANGRLFDTAFELDIEEFGKLWLEVNLSYKSAQRHAERLCDAFDLVNEEAPSQDPIEPSVSAPSERVAVEDSDIQAD